MTAFHSPVQMQSCARASNMSSPSLVHPLLTHQIVLAPISPLPVSNCSLSVHRGCKGSLAVRLKLKKMYPSSAWFSLMIATRSNGGTRGVFFILGLYPKNAAPTHDIERLTFTPI